MKVRISRVYEVDVPEDYLDKLDPSGEDEYGRRTAALSYVEDELHDDANYHMVNNSEVIQFIED